MPSVSRKANGAKEREKDGEVPFPHFSVVLCQGPPHKKQTIEIDGSKFSVRGGLTEKDINEILGIETLDQFRERMRADGQDDWAKLTFDPAKDFVTNDEEGQTICCRHINRQRPFTRENALDLGHRVLNRHWAGPTCFKGRTVNGSAFEITTTGDLHNGMHRGLGFKFACQLARKQGHHWLSKDLWPVESYPDGPVLDTLVIYGISDEQEIIRTIDDCQARTKADVAFTGTWFDSYSTYEYDQDGRTRKRRALNPKERKELSRMLARAAEFLWQRTGQEEINQWAKYLDHAEFEEFVKRHGRLVKAVEWIFEENRERTISRTRLSVAECAAMLYLMAGSKSDRLSYVGITKGSGDSPPSERRMDLSLWEPACSFWAELSKGPDTSSISESVRNAFAQIGEIETDDDDDSEGDEKIIKAQSLARQVVLAKAWQWLLDNAKVMEGKGESTGKMVLNTKAKIPLEELAVDYVEKGAETEEGHSGVWVLNSFDGFGGIDVGLKRPAEKKPKKPKTDKAEARRLSAEEAAELLKKRREEKATKEELKRLADSPLPRQQKPESAKKTPRGPSSKSITDAQTAKALKLEEEEAAAGNPEAIAALKEHKARNLKGGL